MNDKNTTWIEIDSGALENNLRTIADLSGKRKIAAALKANAYGHGIPEIAALLKENSSVEYIALHSAAEAARARHEGWDRRILIVGYIPVAVLDAVFELKLEPTVYNLETINKLGRLSNKYKQEVDIHLKIETGTNRQGVEIDRLVKFATAIKSYPQLNVKGISTHFANIEDTTDHSYAESQLGVFNRAVKQAGKLGLKAEYRHTACSAALLLFEETKFELVRPGIALYGLWPSKETYLSYRLKGGENNILSPVMTWKTRVAQIKEVPADAYVGYGCTFRTTSRTRLAILPIGYYEGYDRSLSNLSHVLIKGKRAPVRGRICMNLMMVDITDIKGVRLEEEVVLLGKSGSERISADQLALWAGTVNYEIISRINENIPRVII